MTGTTHIIGAGLAGLACAAALASRGSPVAVYEAAGQAGGRCRSYHDELLGRLIDNGNHLILGANPALFNYLDTIGARGRITCPDAAIFPFVDLRTGERWTVRPNRSRLPWWVFAPSRRIPGTRWHDYLSGLRLAFAPRSATVAVAMRNTKGPIVERLLEPLTVAVLNASIEEGAAALLWPVMRLTFGAGEAACRPYFARHGLGPDLVEPGLAFLKSRGAEVHFGARLRRFEIDRDTVKALDFGSEMIALGSDDIVVLAVPPSVAVDLVPGLKAPLETRAIVNAHFLLSEPVTLPEKSRLLGVIGGTAQWIFARGNVVSVTVSAADALAERPAEEIAALIWSDVANALDYRNQPMPPHRVVKERRATFAQTPAMLKLRAPTRGRFNNLFCAGDWTDTGLPATIEGAVRSGQKAARHVLARH
ncbi:MAG: FAD-binding protein [Alphaproteobacteria bacterium]|nr:FAD-binding protein [Alphaproteobacteria bacterium]